MEKFVAQFKDLAHKMLNTLPIRSYIYLRSLLINSFKYSISVGM